MNNDPSCTNGKRRVMHVAIVVGILLLAVVLRLHWCTISVGSDDLASWAMALELAGKTTLAGDEVFSPGAMVRYGLNLPLAGMIALFGPHLWAGVIVPFTSSLIGILLVWDLARRLGGSPWVGHLAAAMMAISTLDIGYSTVMLPDMTMNAVGLGGLWLIVITQQGTSTGWRRWLSFAGGGFLCGYAIFTKEAGTVFAAGVFLWLISCLWRRQLRWAHAAIVLGLLVAIGGELTFLTIRHGDPLHRYRVVKRAIDQTTDFHRSKNGAEKGYSLAEHKEKICRIAKRMEDRLPGASVALVVGVLGGAAFLVIRRKEPAVCLLGLTLLAFVLIRLPETWKTFSFQPRRYLTGTALGAVMLTALFAAIYQRGRPALWRRIALVVCALLIPGWIVCLLVQKDSRFLRAEADKGRIVLSSLRWIDDHANAVRADKFRSDHRTLRWLNIASGLRLGDESLRTYPWYDNVEFIAHAPFFADSMADDVWKKYAEWDVTSSEDNRSWAKVMNSGFWLVHPRIGSWVNGRHPGIYRRFVDVPRNWRFVARLDGGRHADGYILQAMPDSTAMAPNRVAHDLSPSPETFGQWRQSGTETETIAWTDDNHPRLIASAGKRLVLKSPWLPADVLFPSGAPLSLVELPGRQEFPTKQGRWLVVGHGRCGDGSTVELFRLRGRRDREAFATAVADLPADLRGIRLTVQLDGPGELIVPPLLVRPLTEVQPSRD
ncbi:MAG: glycosyltransferase family 39 protein [Planctomycetota bacterium]|jgi:hypothetical protein